MRHQNTLSLSSRAFSAPYFYFSQVRYAGRFLYPYFSGSLSIKTR